MIFHEFQSTNPPRIGMILASSEWGRAAQGEFLASRLMIDIHLETYLGVLMQDLQLPALGCRMKIKNVCLVAEAERDHVRKAAFNHGQSADGR